MADVAKPLDSVAVEPSKPEQKELEKVAEPKLPSEDGHATKPADSPTKSSEEENAPTETKKPDKEKPKEKESDSNPPVVDVPKKEVPATQPSEEEGTDPLPVKIEPKPTKTDEKSSKIEESQKLETEVPGENAPDAKPPAEKAPDAVSPEVKNPVVKGSLTETVVNAVEGAVIGAGAAAIKELTAKTAGDLKNIEKGLQQELVAETKDGLPSLAEIGEGIVDVVETIGEEIVEGAEIVIKEVKAHPELIAEGAVAVAIGVASIVQPELIVGSVAMIGKMAADRAKITANEIAVEASTHVVNELSKDLNEELAQHAKVEATTTKTDTVKTEKNVDEAAGTITKKEIKQSVKETTIQIVPKEPAPASTSAVDADLKTVDSKEVNQSATEAVQSDAIKTPAEPTKRNTAADAENVAPDGKHSSVVIKSTTKTTSIKIDEDGTITIGTDSPKDIEPAKIAKISTTDANNADASAAEVKPPGASTNLQTDASKSLEHKINEAIEQVGGSVPAAKDAQEVVKAMSPEPLTVSPGKPSLPTTIPDGFTSRGGDQGLSALTETLLEIHKKLDALNMTNSSHPKEMAGQIPQIVDAHTHESLDQIHQKLDGIIHLRTDETQAVLSSRESGESTTAPVEEEKEHVLSSAMSKIHIKLDELLLSNAEVIKAAATKKEQASELATQKDLEKLHEKLDKMQEALAIKSDLEEGIVPVHKKMDAIHEAILSDAKSAPFQDFVQANEKANDVAAQTATHLENFHKKFEVMQASIDKLTEALAAKLKAEAPPPSHPAAILTPEASGISEPVQTSDSTKDVTVPAQNPQDATEVLPTAANEITKDSTTKPTPSEPVAESSDTATNSNVEASAEPATPKSPGVKKHVKRSSFFGGFFG